MTHGSLFNGIGGFQLAAAWMGWENIFSCEIDDFCNKVTKKHFPNCIQHGDIKTTDFTIYRGRIDIVTGGFPCQPFSVAGKRKGAGDERFLWHEMLRAIREISPRYVVAENVPGLLSQQGGMVFEQVCSEMEGAGYEAQPVIIPACAVNAPHKRERIWLIAKNTFSLRCDSGKREKEPGQRGQREFSAGNNGRIHSDKNAAHAKSEGTGGLRNKGKEKGSRISDKLPGDNDRIRGDVTDTNGTGCTGEGIFTEPTTQRRTVHNSWEENWYEVATKFCRVDDGIPDRIHRLKALGNAIVPQIAFELFKAIEKIEYEMQNL